MVTKKILLTAIISFMLSACSPDGPTSPEDKPVADDHAHRYTNQVDDSHTESHADDHHDHADGVHEHEDGHEHAPETEAFYGDEAEVTESASSPSAFEAEALEHSSHASEHDHDHDH